MHTGSSVPKNRKIKTRGAMRFCISPWAINGIRVKKQGGNKREMGKKVAEMPDKKKR